ncbi:hypothetical protein HK102_003621 [Quaeritorhiza haematococci]|nr:hypothetical protein HK102_003621 [Quaeritorhiza haematococci]
MHSTHFKPSSSLAFIACSFLIFLLVFPGPTQAVSVSKRQTNPINLAELVPASLRILNISNTQISALVESIGTQNLRNLVTSLPSADLANRLNGVNETNVKTKLESLDPQKIQQRLSSINEQSLQRVATTIQLMGAENLANMTSQRVGFQVEPALFTGIQTTLQDPAKRERIIAVAQATTPQQVLDVVKVIQGPVLALLASNVEAATLDNLKQQALALLNMVAPPGAPQTNQTIAVANQTVVATNQTSIAANQTIIVATNQTLPPA